VVNRTAASLDRIGASSVRPSVQRRLDGRSTRCRLAVNLRSSGSWREMCRMTLRFGVLGRLVVGSNGETVPLQGTKRRALWPTFSRDA
jgi:hypothetical protein